jgi:hypothetical protein
MTYKKVSKISISSKKHNMSRYANITTKYNKYQNNKTELNKKYIIKY